MDTFYVKQANEAMEIGRVKELFSQTYWANNRNEEKIKKCIENSLCYGAFTKEEDKLIGFARVITDFVTTYYICDVIVDEEYRGSGAGKALVKMITEDSRLQDMRGMLLTEHAHGLYQQFGFKQMDGIYMGKR
jgi:N-acetylglutamate synthase and related acetyltransferases